MDLTKKALLYHKGKLSAFACYKKAPPDVHERTWPRIITNS